MEEVVDIPRLVGDHQVISLVFDDVVEDHEVVDEDLVHPTDGLEGVQVVLVCFVLEVSRFVDEPLRRRMHALASGFQHGRDRVLSKPFDLEIWMELVELG